MSDATALVNVRRTFAARNAYQWDDVQTQTGSERLLNRITPAKLRNSKWTAVKPSNKERHFLVSDIEFDEEGSVLSCKIEAVMSKNEYLIDWTELKDNEKWQHGWK